MAHEDDADDEIQLAHTPRALAELTGQPPPGYRPMHQMVLNARIPATMRNGRWWIKRVDLPAIAEFLGMIEAPPQPPIPTWSPPYQPPSRPAWGSPMVWPSQQQAVRNAQQTAKAAQPPRRKATTAA